MSWGDWLGSKRRIGGWCSFEDARAFAHSLKLKDVKQWKTYSKSAKKPIDIPTNPHVVYADTGWVDYRDWLGNPQMRAHVSWRSFEDARTFVRGLKLKDVRQWKTYSKSAKKPIDMPASPDRTYADAGWVDWSDWLGLSPRS